MVRLAVCSIGAIAELGDLSAALGVDGKRGRGDVRRVEGDERAVQGVEVCEFGGYCGGGSGERGGVGGVEGDGFAGWVQVERVFGEEVDGGHFV